MNNTLYSGLYEADGSLKKNDDHSSSPYFIKISQENADAHYQTGVIPKEYNFDMANKVDFGDSNNTTFVSSNNTAQMIDSVDNTRANGTCPVEHETYQYDLNYYTMTTNYEQEQPKIPTNEAVYIPNYNVYTGEYYQPMVMGNLDMSYYNDLYQTITPSYVGLPMSLPASPYLSSARSPAHSAAGDYELDNYMANNLPPLSTPSSPCYQPCYNGYVQYLGDTISQFSLPPNMNTLKVPGTYDEFDEAFYAIVDEIVENTKFLPPKNSEVKCSLDSNHPIHCVWKDMNRGHFSWRCRWWENGKRLSKNFNIKRFGDLEAMRMAITMKLKNSTPSERLQLLKEQREVVRATMKRRASANPSEPYTPAASQISTPIYSGQPPSPNLSELSGDNEEFSVEIQNENFSRLSWAYTMLNRQANEKDSTLRCKICRKVVKTFRGSNIEQSFFLHLFRMHKNPWKQYVDERGLDLASKNMLNNLYAFHGMNDRTPWKVNLGLCRP